MSTVHACTEIDVSPEEVWQTIMNPARLGEWVTIHKSVSNVQSPLKHGATMEQTLQMRGVSFRVKWCLAEMHEPHKAVWEGQGPARSKARIQYELSPRPGGGTRFDYTNEFSPPGGMLGNVASRVVVGAASEREAKNSLSRLKALLERS